MEKNSWSIGKSALLTDLGMCINHYRLQTVGLFACINVGVKINGKLWVPDMIVMVNFGRNKQCVPDFENNYFDGPPNFILDVYNDPEIVKERKQAFAVAGVQEYLLVSENLSKVEWNRQSAGKFKKIKPDKEGIIRSSGLPGLWVPIPALKKRDFWTIKACIEQGMTRREHHSLMESIWNKD